MMCQRIGFSPISIIGFGFKWLSSLILVPKPPAKITTFIFNLSSKSSSMFSRNLPVLDFVRRFFVSCAQISEAYVGRTSMKFGCDWRKIGDKSKCRKDSGRTSSVFKHHCHYLSLKIFRWFSSRIRTASRILSVPLRYS